MKRYSFSQKVLAVSSGIAGGLGLLLLVRLGLLLRARGLAADADRVPGYTTSGELAIGAVGVALLVIALVAALLSGRARRHAA